VLQQPDAGALPVRIIIAASSITGLDLAQNTAHEKSAAKQRH
jgi:hypothetical protein